MPDPNQDTDPKVSPFPPDPTGSSFDQTLGTAPPQASSNPSPSILTDTSMTAPSPAQDTTVADSNTPPSDSNSSDSVVTAPHTPKKYGGKKAIATIFGVLLLIGGVAAGVFLVQRQQLLEQQAASGRECQQTRDCILLENPGNSGSFNAPKTIRQVKITNQNIFEYSPGDTNDGCYHVNINGTSVSWNKVGSGPDCKDISNIQVWLSDTEMNVSCHGTVSCDGWTFFFNHPLDEQAIVTVTVDGQTVGSGQIGPSNDPTSTLSGPWTGPIPEAGKTVVFNIKYHGDRVREVTMPDLVCEVTGTPTPTSKLTSTPSPTRPPGVEARCNAVLAYDSQWNLLTSSDLNNLDAGDVVRFAVSGTASSGTFDKAKFTINGVEGPEVTTKKPGSDEFYYEYTIPAGASSFNVSAQIHHSSLGWF